MKLEVGMYVRTKNGEIGIIRAIIDGLVFINTNQYYSTITKASHNIIDLIEVGDYVNGYKVIEVDFDAEEEKYIRVDKSQDGLKTILRLNDIKSIVTKEQFESISYEVSK